MKKISDLILHKDHHIIVLNKPSGLPTQSDKSGDPNAHQMTMAYAHRDLYIVHRLDRRVSGVLVFAKTKESAAFLSGQFNSSVSSIEQHQTPFAIKKIYLGIVPSADIPGEGTLIHYLTYDQKSNFTTAHPEPFSGSDEAKLIYKMIQHLENFMVIRIELITGRKHQIRAQLAAMGIPIRGDIKYGSKRTNPDGSIDLHAMSIELLHPSTRKSVTFTAPFPDEGLWKHVVLPAHLPPTP